MAAARIVYVIISPFGQSQISCLTVPTALNFSPLSQTVASMWDLTPPSVHPQVQSSSHSSFPPDFFCPTEFAWFYIFFSGGQVLLLALSWCSVRSSVCEGIFLMNPWREKYSLSTYASTILDLLNIPIFSFLRNLCTLLQSLYQFTFPSAV